MTLKNSNTTGDVNKCILDYDYALFFELEVFLHELKEIVDFYEGQNGTTYDNNANVWFMDLEKIGLNRMLLNDFITLANHAKMDGISMCFLMSLNRVGESVEFSQLSILKHGEIIIKDFQAPSAIWKIDEEFKGVNDMKLKIYYDEKNTSTYVHKNIKHQLTQTIEKLSTTVRYSIKYSKHYYF